MRQNPMVNGWGSGFGPPRSSRSCFWSGLEPKWPVFTVQTQTAGGLPGPVANSILGNHPRMRSVTSILVLCWCRLLCDCRGIWLVPFVMVLGRCYFLDGCPRNWSVSVAWVPSMFTAFHTWSCTLRMLAPHLGRSLFPSTFDPLTGFVCFISCFFSYLPLFSCGTVPHHCVLSLPDENPVLGCISGQTAELEGAEPYTNSPVHLSQHPIEFLENELFWDQEGGMICLATQPWGSTHIVWINENSTRVRGNKSWDRLSVYFVVW